MKLSVATTVLLAQTALCDAVLQAREAKITTAPVLADHNNHRQDRRRAQKDECNDGKTACGDGNGCCPRGSKCTAIKGVGMCADACGGATLFCEFAKGIKVCCQPGASCDYSQSVCTQASTGSGGVWTLLSTSSVSVESALPTTPVFTGREGGNATSTSGTESESTSTSKGGSESESTATESSDGAASTEPSKTDAGTSPTKDSKDSGSAMVASWSAGVLVLVFGIMSAL